ncbi:effector-associated constant component EACC1 [Kribbella monticola]|uniref:effector-associated constant component EACC1 n=1 Tax=Kribbella monticola TaxID=2185285 RepID=UPI000DD4E20C|nr:hypothetical protein [Kribbella monticola]
MAEWAEIQVMGGEPEEVERAVRRLREELGEHEFETRAVQAAMPEGAKGDGAVVGAVAVALVGAGGMIPTLILVLRDWLGRRADPQRITVTIGADSIELDRPSFTERERLLEAFLAKHTGG